MVEAAEAVVLSSTKLTYEEAAKRVGLHPSKANNIGGYVRYLFIYIFIYLSIYFIYVFIMATSGSGGRLARPKFCAPRIVNTRWR